MIEVICFILLLPVLLFFLSVLAPFLIFIGLFGSFIGLMILSQFAHNL